jgi:SPP1 family predicted phage head-tail adaptor
MNIGRMDRRIQLLREQERSRTASGQRDLQWLPIATPWAERRVLKGGELLGAQQRYAKVEASYRIRYRSGVTTTLRLHDLRDGKTYDIGAILDPDRFQSLELLASARAEAATP